MTMRPFPPPESFQPGDDLLGLRWVTRRFDPKPFIGDAPPTRSPSLTLNTKVPGGMARDLLRSAEDALWRYLETLPEEEAETMRRRRYEIVDSRFETNGALVVTIKEIGTGREFVGVDMARTPRTEVF